jgi:hypothetical protein
MFGPAPRSFVSAARRLLTGEPKNAGRSGTINDDHEEKLNATTHKNNRTVSQPAALP